MEKYGPNSKVYVITEKGKELFAEIPIPPLWADRTEYRNALKKAVSEAAELGEPELVVLEILK